MQDAPRIRLRFPAEPRHSAVGRLPRTAPWQALRGRDDGFGAFARPAVCLGYVFQRCDVSPVMLCERALDGFRDLREADLSAFEGFDGDVIGGAEHRGERAASDA